MGKTFFYALIAVLMLFDSSLTQAGRSAIKYRVVAEATPHSELCQIVQKGLDDPTDPEDPFSSKVFLPWHELGYQPDFGLAFHGWLVTTPLNDGHEYAILRNTTNPGGSYMTLYPDPDAFTRFLGEAEAHSTNPSPPYPSWPHRADTIIDAATFGFTDGRNWQGRPVDGVEVGKDPAISLSLLTPALAKNPMWRYLAHREFFQRYGFLSYGKMIYMASYIAYRDTGTYKENWETAKVDVVLARCFVLITTKMNATWSVTSDLWGIR